MNNFEKQVSRIALIDGYEYRYLLIAIAQYLKLNYQSFVCVYVHSEDAKSELEPYIQQGYMDEIKIIPKWKDIALQKLSSNEIDSVLEKAVANEQQFGITYNKVRMTRRDIGFGFYLGAYYHPRSVMSELPAHEQIVNAYNFIFDFWKNEFKEGRITLLINGLKEEEVVAKAFHIPFRYLFCTRIENYFHWTRNLFCEFPEVKSHYQRLLSQTFQPIELKQQFFLDVTHKKRLFSSGRFKRLIKKSIALVHENLYRIIKRSYSKGYYFFSCLRHIWKEYKDMKRLTYPVAPRLFDIKDKKFIYFPLATEPEMSLHWMSPECTSQLAVIHAIARDLPSDTFLVVKEAIYSVGKRSDEFYDHITGLKNTILLDVKELGLDVISKATVIATISGTSGLEGAIMGKPVILFGRHNYYDFLDHVFLIKEDEQVAPAIQKALQGFYDKEKAKIDGARLRQAAINASFDLKNFTNIHRKHFDDEIVRNIVEGLKESLTEEHIPALRDNYVEA